VGAIDARADQKILPGGTEGGDFLRLAKRTLVSFGNQTCNFAIMFGVFRIEIWNKLQ
jgi:hypothetical protein